MLNKIAVAMAAVIMVVILGLVGAEDYQDEITQAEHCATMVEAGKWPKAVCNG